MKKISKFISFHAYCRRARHIGVFKYFLRGIFPCSDAAAGIIVKIFYEPAAPAYYIFVKPPYGFFHGKGWWFSEESPQKLAAYGLLIYSLSSGMEDVEQSEPEIIFSIRIYDADVIRRIGEDRRMSACVHTAGSKIKADLSEYIRPEFLLFISVRRRHAQPFTAAVFFRAHGSHRFCQKWFYL